MIFDVARAADVLGIGRAPGEFAEDRPVGLGHDVGEDVQPAAMGHPEDDLADPVLAAIFDHRLERRDHGLPAVQAEALGADIFAREELLPLLGLDHLLEDRLLAFGGESDLGVAALHALLKEAALGDVVDVHIFETDIAAIIAAKDLDDLTHRAPLQAERSAQPDLAVERRAGEAVIFGGEVGGHLPLGEPERIEIGGEMAAHPVGADQHHRADAVVRRLLDVGVRLAGRGGGLLRLGRDLLDRHRGRVEAGIDLVQLVDGPVAARPARSLLAFAADDIQVGQPSHLHVVMPAQAGIQADFEPHLSPLGPQPSLG